MTGAIRIITIYPKQSRAEGSPTFTGRLEYPMACNGQRSTIRSKQTQHCAG
jgi:hypothetical protein